MRESLRRALELEGYEIELASDGEEALRRLDLESPVDAAILDVLMPGIDGLEVCEAAAEYLGLTEAELRQGLTDMTLAELAKGKESPSTDLCKRSLPTPRRGSMPRWQTVGSRKSRPRS